MKNVIAVVIPNVIKMAKADQKIIVVDKENLFRNGRDFFEGFRLHGKVDYESRILDNMKIMRRGSLIEDPHHPRGNAERNPDYKQPIGYGIVVNDQNRVFAYQRSKDDRKYSEKRLQGKWSWGFGGHIEPMDGSSNPIRESLIREVTKEEIQILGNVREPRVLGYIYHDFDVHAVHFGILYLIQTDATIVKANDPEIAIVKGKTLSELEEICASPDIDVEEWSRTALDPLKRYFETIK